MRFLHRELLISRHHHLWYWPSFLRSLTVSIRLSARFTPRLRRSLNRSSITINISPAILVSQTFGNSFVTFLSNILLLCLNRICFLHRLELVKLLVDIIHVECLRLYGVVHSLLKCLGFTFHEGWLFTKRVVLVTPILFFIIKSMGYQLLSFRLCTLFRFKFAARAASAYKMIGGDRAGIDDISYASSGRMLNHTISQFGCFITRHNLFLQM